MGFPQIEPSTPHLVYTLLSLFLLLYALFSELVRNRLHLSEPPLATLAGIAFGPHGITVLAPIQWGFEDNVTQELTRVLLGIQVFAVGIDLPAGYVKRHWRSITTLLGPVMIMGWLVSAAIVYFVLQTAFTTALIIAACLTPTDPILSASVLGEAHFSHRVPKRLRYLLAAESGCNDGSAFPFLYAALYAVTASSAADGVKSWFLNVIFWQCSIGVLVGVILGFVANKSLRFSESRGYVQESSLFVFYLLLAILCVGVGSTLGLDDFLVAFTAGATFCWDGWFASKTKKMKLPSIIDLLLNSGMFVYFGALIPWQEYRDNLGPSRLIACVVLILILRRLPAILAMKRLIPDIRTWNEAIFTGHFGPMGVGALFLAIESRARLETGTSEPLPHPPFDPPTKIKVIWPVVCFIVLGSIMVHGFSAAVMSIAGHFARDPKERAPLLGGEAERLYGMADDHSTFSDDSDEAGDPDL